ncbi:MAG: two-component regulator propeller domain-containing protein [Paludibacter sp.]|nr:two-component regulator propeller domain-containing protein [Paludibacter sp.]
MKKRTLLIFFVLIFSFSALIGQEHVVFQHFSVENGLSQNTVMAIMQDSKGFMWFGTWDGLNKFDGYEFTVYKSHPGDHSNIANNRIDYIHEDKFGYIWFQTYDGKIHRFNPKTEQFYSLPYSTSRFVYSVERSNRFIETSNGELWIATNDIGAIRIVTNPESEEVKLYEYSTFSEFQIDNNCVNFIHEDGQKNIWLGTNDGLFAINPVSNQIKTYQPNSNANSNAFFSFYNSKNDIWFGDKNGFVWHFSTTKNSFEIIKLKQATKVTDIEAVGKDHLIFTTNSSGFYVYSLRNKSLINFDKSNTASIKTSKFISVKVDSYGVAWLEAEQTGVFRFRLSDNSLKHFQLKTDAVSRISVLPNFIVFEDINKRLWINPQGGGFSRYNRNTDELEYFYNEPGSAQCRFSNVIHSVFTDKKGTLWMCTYNKGLEKISFFSPQFRLGKPNPAINTLTSNEVRAFYQLSNGNILISTKDGSIRFLDHKFNDLGLLSTNGTLSGGDKLTDLAYCFLEDSKKNIWIGTKGMGVIKLIPRKNNAGKPEYQLQRFQNNPLDNNSLSNDNVYSIIEDASKRILIGTFGGGLNVVSETNGKISFINYRNQLTNYPINKCMKIRHLLMDKTNTLWIATTNGMLQIDNFLTPKMKEYYIEKLPDISNSLSNNDVHYFHLDKENQLWIGTFGGGLNKLLTKSTASTPATFENFSIRNGMSNDIVLSIQEDNSGNLWLSSENSISRFDRKSHFFQNYDMFDGIENAHFSEAASLYTKSGEMLFGSNKGYYYFKPSNIKQSKEVPAIEFTKFQLFNNNVEIGAKGSPLKQSIGSSEVIELTHKQSVFSIEYVALDFSNPEKIHYAFMLENFESDWNYVQSQRKATYTNLPKGTYYFKVRSTNSEGVWTDNVKVIKIKILPSFWETPFAYILYFICFVLLMYLVYYLTTMYAKLKNEVVIEQKVTDIKLRFFTNISHELRTPLTLISGPVENVLNNEKLSENAKDQLHIVQSNAYRMLRLINQILDFRKIQNKKMRLKIQPTRFDKLVKEICSNFSKEAIDKNIDFRISNNAGDAILWIDRDKTDMIIYNLLSNAFKFTPAGKKIEVLIELASDKGDIKVKVIDQGVGIPREKRSFLFERFTSENEIQSLGNKRGTGIGLNLVKELVDLHKGIVEVESEPEKGTTFSVIFRNGKEHFGNDVDFVVEDEIEPEFEAELENIDLSGRVNVDHFDAFVSTKEAPLLVVIEDNDDMRNFLQKVLSKTYRVETAEDGETGWEKIQKSIPDLVVTDLMMPNMDGLQLTDLIKQNETTSHIPVILLTAKSAVESRLQALKSGADDYITKPFSPVLLEARIENILEQRKLLQKRYRKNLLELEPAEVEMASQDEIFLAKLLNFMENNIDNSELTVEDMVSEMAFGRTVFFNKLKGLTGLAPIEFIRELRIKRAAQYLKSGEYNISQVTYMVGMSDSRYFSKCFKKVYGMTPSEYKKSLEHS